MTSSEETNMLWQAFQHTPLAGPSQAEAAPWFLPLYKAMQAAHTQWSAFRLDWFDWCAHVSDALQQSAQPGELEEWVERAHMGDLYLAFACLWGIDEALQQIQQESETMFRQIVRRFAKPPLMPDELLQELWIRILATTEGRQPRLAGYAGQGALNAWLRVTAVRACIDYTRAHPHLKRETLTDKEQLLALPEQTFDIELEFLKREYREHFREAFAKGVKALPSRDRLLLRYHVLEGLSIDQIGALFQQHRSTAARHLNQARQRLLEGTESALMQELDITQTEFKSVMRLIQSKWEVSVQRLLAQQRFSSLAHDIVPDPKSQ